MQAIFGKNFKGGIKLRSYCKQHSPTVSVDNGLLSQADKIDASGVKEIDMTNLADDRLQDSSEELDYFWKYVDVNEVHKNISESYSQARKLKSISDHDSQHDSTPKKETSSTKKSNCTAKPETSLKRALSSGNSPKKSKLTVDEEFEKSSTDIDPLVVDLIYRYWILLRTANNGQSLIKFSPTALKEREYEQRKSIMKLRIELERVRNLSYMIGKREKLKCSWLKTHQNIIKRTFNVINDLFPPTDSHSPTEHSANDIALVNQNAPHINQNPHVITNSKRYIQPTQLLQLTPNNGIIDESDQLINDLITCDQVYDTPQSSSNSNYSNLSYQERSTLERRRTLSLVRRINRQLKSVSVELSQNPYAKSYLAPKRSDSPVGSAQASARLLKNR